MKKYSLPLIAILITTISWSLVSWQKSLLIEPETRIVNLLYEWEGKQKSHVRNVIDTEKAEIGRQLSLNGWAMQNGKKSKVISKFFVCTDCHNQVIEDPDLVNPRPETRLAKAKKDNLPFLQGTTFYGTVNHNNWYNEDYYLKYGSLVASAKDTLENAIQLCAKVCSSGRYLDAWELEAIVQYYNTIDYKIKDLNLNDDELESLRGSELSNLEKASLIRSKYKDYSPATFLKVIPKKERECGKTGDAENGKTIYIQSCMACHSYEKKFTHLKLDTTAVSLKFMANFVKKDHPFSIYDIVRKGTTAEFAIREYMPHYTEERMSQQQLEDLTRYILQF